MVSIRAPARLRNNGGIWDGTGWMALDVDRVDFSVNNNVQVYTMIDEETELKQMEASKHQIMIGGHITSDSDLVGSSVTIKAKNLMLIMRQWYVDLKAGSSGFPEVSWENSTWDFLPQKVIVVDVAEKGDEIMNYQLSCILIHD